MGWPDFNLAGGDPGNVAIRHRACFSDCLPGAQPVDLYFWKIWKSPNVRTETITTRGVGVRTIYPGWNDPGTSRGRSFV